MGVPIPTPCPCRGCDRGRHRNGNVCRYCHGKGYTLPSEWVEACFEESTTSLPHVSQNPRTVERLSDSPFHPGAPRSPGEFAVQDHDSYFHPSRNRCSFYLHYVDHTEDRAGLWLMYPSASSGGSPQKVNCGAIDSLVPNDGALYEISLPADCPFSLAMRLDASGGVSARWLS
jgi:hypothetical protein